MINKTYYTILSLSFPKYLKDSYNIIASSHYLGSTSMPININSPSFVERLEMVYNNHLKIVIITDDFTKLSSEKIGDSISNDYMVLNIPSDLFFSKDGIENILIKNKNIHQFIFIFRNKDYGEIVAKLALFNIIISGGSNTKKHILSPIQLRLARFLIAIYPLTGSDVANSFHSEIIKGRSKVDLTIKENKEEIAESLDFKNKEIEYKEEVQNHPSSKFKVDSIVKREFHSSSYLSLDEQNHKVNKVNSKSIEVSAISVKDNNKSGESSILSYLDSIQSIINNPENTLEKSQSLIENSWISILLEQLKDEKKLINKYSHRFSNILVEANKTLNSLQENNVIKKKFPLIYKDLDSLDFIFLSYSLCLSYSNRLGYTSIAELIGNNILYRLFKKSEGSNLSDFKNQFTDSNIISYKLGDFFITLLTQFPHDLFERNISPSSYYSKEVATLNINSEYLEDIKNNIIVHPYTLPMLCKPNIWSDDSYGGFLDNINKEVSIITGSNRHNHLVENKEALFKTINNLNSIRFTINNRLLDYLNNEGKFLLDLIKEENDSQRAIILKIAESFSKVPFYLNVHADWRGRIYTQSFFITYQGGDLSSALLNFWEGSSLTKIGKLNLYIHGANNHNEGNISKKSFENRITWVKDNYNKIISLDTSLILSAEKPFVFLAFCLNMRELHNNPRAFINTPVFLDATCSGIQHLSALLLDLELGISVNLSPYKQEDGPNDIYSDLIEPINKAINKFGEDNSKFASLSLIELNRKIIKTSIMTKVYNVSQYGIARQLESKLEIKEEDTIEQISMDLTTSLKKKKRLNLLIAPGKDNTSVLLNKSDIFKIAEIINNQIFVIFPSLNNIYSYFIEMAQIMVELGLPITWITPSGLKITQHYLKSKQTVISTKLFKQSKKMIIRESLNKLDRVKQTNAIIPNIIHSLDATHLINLINKAENQGFTPIITVHDCFGTLPNKMDELGFMVKREFVILYSQDNFLETYHNRLIQSIKDNNYEVIFNKIENSYFVINNEISIKIPNIPKLGRLDLKKIEESKYMIS